MDTREFFSKTLEAEKPKFVRVLRAVPLEFVLRPAPATLEESLAAYERNATELQRRVARLDNAGWERQARFLVNGKVAWEAPLGEMLWGFVFDAIHHRGQLSTYLRPMGATVPSIYGPSADDPGQ